MLYPLIQERIQDSQRGGLAGSQIAMSCLQLPSALLGGHGVCKPKDDISYQLLLGTSASSVDSEHVFTLCRDNEEEDQPQEVTLNFYLEDGTHQRLVVEENLRALDLCYLLALKISVSKSHTWTLVERLTDLSIERSLEDHEDILQVYSSWGQEGKASENKFIFRQDFRKYEFFHSPQQFFPLDMLDLGVQLDCLSESTDLAKLITLQNMINSGERMPVVQSLLWCKEPEKDSWKRLFFRIDGNTLYASSLDDSRQLWPFRDMKRHDIYNPVEGKNTGTPTVYAFCLKPNDDAHASKKSITWLCCDNERHRQCWIIALRLAKFGKKLHENYKEVKSRFAKGSDYYERDGQSDPSLSDYTPMKSRVAMDFTGNHGRVVDDPKEAEAIAAAEGHVWKRRLPCCRSGTTPSNTCNESPTSRPTFEFGIHTMQPWFYSGMSRDEATQLLTKYGTVDGVFLVRESRRNPGSFVLSYVYNHKVHHCQIIPVEEKEQLCYSLDGGRTKFYDLLQLVEFYQLNFGSLPTKLTHFLVHQPKRKELAE